MTPDTDRPSFTCPRCQRASHHPDDARHGYCGNCHAFTGLRASEPAVFDTLVDRAARGLVELYNASQPNHRKVSPEPTGDDLDQARAALEAAGVPELLHEAPPRRAPEPGTGELGTWKPEVVTAVDALRGLDWTGFDPASLDDLADIAAVVVGGAEPRAGRRRPSTAADRMKKKIRIKHPCYVYHDGLVSGILPTARIGEEYPLHAEETVDVGGGHLCRLVDHEGMVLAVPVYACDVVD